MVINMMTRPHDPAAKWAAHPTWLITQAALHAHRLVADGLAAVDARGHHYRVLATLEQTGPVSQATLGRTSGIHLSDVVAAINELAERGLVHRDPDPTDRRRNTITLTTAGRRQLRRQERRLAKVQDELLAPLAPEEREELVRLLGQVLSHHRNG
ncbi:DNA-binding transcriptional regulator, MarR family [Actinosynnema pretiosum]|uniref:Transcriptional regulator, MarR family n=3 Tax=Pseudonocardiaceae TaxID=2070 RepID=C6WLC2_ACTMD|nr:transcriptional regulator, MarR family [Actinosynnema mirum DSM 43827]AXX29926.1 Transcriptional regulator, MarR family [Actinosynnema pretiosum subsp. pretiosum]MCP2092482.1 DNA-binding transcriptional regulator, MarR family [Actinosynnema pretiosum]